ncbi:MarR family transcriptional regulator [Catellatospora methionotrophica]|uniref:MarR family transcriptional regulator n=1 Tax=Catellatospora methionotrophica TaxID=121620 RepID=A0A8J3LHA6_9ACTN|nr:helix-turn-helix domain-containing protein [Catellatospora methionotrophica]GIG18313.1 MarR family transcriptional regulator [Catellatospora methionotrophica]
MSSLPEREAVGTLLRHVLELLDGDVAKVYAERELADYRPRYSPVVRALLSGGPMPIRDLARAVGVTHSAASQTVAQMSGAGLVDLTPGADARQRLVSLTPKAHWLLPLVTAEWTATTAAMRTLDSELSMPLVDLLTEVATALTRRPFRARIADAGLPEVAGDPYPAQHGDE